MKKKSLGKNAVLNVIKSILSVIFPLITYPYAFRILHVENIGKVDYVTSIISYFSLIAMLGVSSYAVREGARIRDNRKEITQFANEIFSINVISTGVSYFLLSVVVIITDKLHVYAGLIVLMSISILFTTLGVDWINTIYEDFLFITIRSIVTHVVTMLLLFIFVRDEEDYYIYALLFVLINIIIGVSNWIYCKKYISLRFTLRMNIRKHIKPIFTLFANNVATSIYVNCDTTMLGWMVGDYNVGLYAMAVKIYNVLKNIMAAIYTVTISRLSFYIGKKELDKLKETYTNLFGAITLLLLPLSAGVIGVAPEIIYFMGGKEYFGATITLRILSIALIGAIFGGLMAYCFNIPMGREIINLKATSISAVINVVLNIFMIPLLQQNGAAITTAISEWFVFLFCILSSKDINKYIYVRYFIMNLKDAILGAGLIIGVSMLIHRMLLNAITSMMLIFILGVIVYILFLFILKNKLFMTFLLSIRKYLIRKRV